MESGARLSSGEEVRRQRTTRGHTQFNFFMKLIPLGKRGSSEGLSAFRPQKSLSGGAPRDSERGREGQSLCYERGLKRGSGPQRPARGLPELWSSSEPPLPHPCLFSDPFNFGKKLNRPGPLVVLCLLTSSPELSRAPLSNSPKCPLLSPLTLP